MDYCDAGTLEEVSKIGMPQELIQQYTAQLASAVAVLHDRGFVHRDIKGTEVQHVMTYAGRFFFFLQWADSVDPAIYKSKTFQFVRY